MDNYHNYDNNCGSPWAHQSGGCTTWRTPSLQAAGSHWRWPPTAENTSERICTHYKQQATTTRTSSGGFPTSRSMVRPCTVKQASKLREWSSSVTDSRPWNTHPQNTSRRNFTNNFIYFALKIADLRRFCIFTARCHQSSSYFVYRAIKRQVVL